jgi:hypothetical protein
MGSMNATKIDHLAGLLLVMCSAAIATPLGGQQIRVNPVGVNVNAHGPTTVFLTFGGLANHLVAEALWCGEVIPAAPDIGERCDPTTIFGSLPARFDHSTRSGGSGFTDIMSIPTSVARRAYQAAEGGQVSTFFYVRRFVDLSGGPDQYVAVTCRLTGGGARVPLSLVDVRLGFDVETPVLFLEAGASVPALAAEITYNGTGRLKGRWEVVLPGEELPEPRDLLTEATLPLEERLTQRRYTEVGRFNVFLPPTGRFVLDGPRPARLPTDVEGSYLVLLRIEATEDKEGDSNLGAVGAGNGVVPSGGVAGFPMPPLRYVVGSGGSEHATPRDPGELRQILPAHDAQIPPGGPLEFGWTPAGHATAYRLEVNDERGERILEAIIGPASAGYRAPPWLTEAPGELRWRVVALDRRGTAARRTDWWTVRVAQE